MKLPKNAELWFGSYLRERLRRRFERTPPKRLWVAITDHYEPLGGKVPIERALQRVARWQEYWPKIADAAPWDATGKLPGDSIFYPQEEDRSERLAPRA